MTEDRGRIVLENTKTGHNKFYIISFVVEIGTIGERLWRVETRYGKRSIYEDWRNYLGAGTYNPHFFPNSESAVRFIKGSISIRVKHGYVCTENTLQLTMPGV